MKKIAFRAMTLLAVAALMLPTLIPLQANAQAFTCADVSEIPQTECEALVALYNSTGGANWADNTNWLVTNAPSGWYGVTVVAGQVTQITLHYNRLAGSIPSELGNLTALESLNLSRNQLTGSIPPELGNLTALQELWLHSNDLTGSIPPALSNLTALQRLSLSYNQLTGDILVELGNLTALEILNLSRNDLTGSIPPELGNLTALQYLHLDYNELTGNIPPELGNLTALTYLNLDADDLTGSIPPELSYLTALEYLNLRSNQLIGSIPPELGNLTALQWLYLDYNQLTGNIPPELGNLAVLRLLGIDSNQLTGSIPPELGNLTALQGLWLSDNQLTGSIPPELGNLTALQNLSIYNNLLTGSLPSELGNLAALHLLYLNGNQLTGSIPLSFTNLGVLDYFHFYDTQLCEPNDPAFIAWKATVIQWGGTGDICGAGFLPNPDGYSFENYSEFNAFDFTTEDMRRMFGDDAVCEFKIGSLCYPKYPALLWNGYANFVLTLGHCDGMSTTSLRFYKDIDTHPSYEDTFDMNLDSQVQVNWQGETFTTSLRKNIAFFFAEQMTSPVSEYVEQIRHSSPSEILQQLEESFANGMQDPTNLQINPSYTKLWGHTITPYTVQDQGDGVYWIMVYDNMYPGDDTRYVEVDTITNFWSYDLGVETWWGNTVTDSMAIVPISLYAQRPECPWCNWFTDSLAKQQVSFIGNGHLLLTNSQGQRLGYEGSEYYSEIPGAYGSVIKAGPGVELEPIYTLPYTDTYTITLNGSPTGEAGEASLSQFGPGYAVVVDDLWIDSGTSDTLTIANNGASLTYQPNQAREATLGLALDMSGSSWLLEVKNMNTGAGELQSLAADTVSGKLEIDSSQASGGVYNLVIEQTGADGWQRFYHQDIPMPSGATHYANFAAWDGEGVILLEVDLESDGIVDEIIELENEIVKVFLPTIWR